ncbi:MAG: HDOD domain-containing protein [Sedimentisphaerales bacterium]|nr:HDOD domain-containing protein [Sedimentisphaerales bacterium]
MNDKIRILFVDDESNILDGLRRMLHSMRKEWDMTFAEGGQAALDILAEKSFDVIVSDMRMPGIDGAQLLEKVRRNYPHIARIALSGQTSKKTILRSVGLIHQYLTKPCNTETLRTTISNVCSLRDLLTNEKLRGLIAQLESLPSLPSLYAELIEQIRDNDCSVDEVAKIISRDVGMSAKIMQLVNSAFFGVGRHVSDISQAVTLLGLETIASLTLSMHIFSQYDDIKPDGFSLSCLWDHSITVAEMARLIARSENAEKSDTGYCFLAGMLHDIGKLVLAVQVPQKYQQVLSLCSSQTKEMHEAEREVLQTTHAEIGAYLLGLWGFSDDIITAIAFHHKPAEAAATKFSALTIVHVANILAHETDSVSDKNIQPDTQYLNALGLTNRLPRWREICLDNLKVRS